MGKYIATTQEVIQLLQLTDSKSTVIDAYLLPVTKEVIKYCNNSFHLSGIYLESSEIVFSGSTLTADTSVDFSDLDFYVEDTILISGSARNDNLYELSTVVDNVLTATEEFKAEDSERTILIEKISFPDELKIPFANIIKFYLNQDNGKTSFSLADYSWSAASSDWPDSIRRSLNKFRKLYGI